MAQLRLPDPQQFLVYEWERLNIASLPGANIRLEMPEVLAMAQRIMPEVTYAQIRVGGPGAALGGLGGIKLPEWARRPWVVVHEMSHHIVRKRESQDSLMTSPGHGARFMGCYLKLVGEHLGGNVGALVESALESGIAVGDDIFALPSGTATMTPAPTQSIDDLTAAVRHLRRKLAQTKMNATKVEVRAVEKELGELELRLKFAGV